MSAGRYETHQRKAGPCLRVNPILQPRGIDVTFKMIHADKWQVVGERHPLRSVDSHQQRARETRTVRNGDAVELVQLQASLFERAIHDRNQRAHVLARRHLRDDPAVLRMHVHLCRHDVGDYVAAVLDNSSRCLIAGCFYS